MSTATVYSHRFDAPNDEATGVLGGTELGVPGYWTYSVEIAKAWERAQDRAETPYTRKVGMRSAMVMSPDRGGIFDVLLRLARFGLGGPVAGGAQYVSGAFALRSDTELLLKSRRVVPSRLLEAGFAFDHAQWPEAADDLVRRVRGGSGFTG
ncbi:DUF1731 domain-containing protein [Microtetraspora glauca]|uniref:DUF1731 domain-containing protein n=1 Tax=Microtetraspora glauca TaxID=1996 RepID=A0ABV3GN35_MICGL